MKNYIFIFLLFVAMFLGACKNEKVENKASDTQNTTSISENNKEKVVFGDEVLDSKEFQNYFDIFFKQSDSKTNQTLIYINKFISDNNITVSEGACWLLKNEKIKSDSICYNYFDKRCKFIEARRELRKKFNIDGDSIKKLMKKAIEIKRASDY